MSVTSSGRLIDQQHDQRDFRMIDGHGIGHRLQRIMVLPVRGGALISPALALPDRAEKVENAASHVFPWLFPILRRPWG